MEEKILCPVCINDSFYRLTKGDVKYNQCSCCKTLFTLPLNNEDKVGGEFEEERNIKDNDDRIGRVIKFSTQLGIKENSLNVLDFGCGHGILLNDFKNKGIKCDGYDAFNPLYSKLPPKNTYDFVTMIEVIEHTSSPFSELDVIRRSLKEKGIVMIETSFIDVANEENIQLEEFHYISPEAGHSTIFSHHGLDFLMFTKGFIPCRHVNRHVRIYQKNNKWG